MSKTLNEAALTTRNARKGLPLGVHWRGLNPDVHLGYRKQKRGGRWLVRWYGLHDGAKKYRQKTIGPAEARIAWAIVSRKTLRRAADSSRSRPSTLPTLLSTTDALLLVR